MSGFKSSISFSFFLIVHEKQSKSAQETTNIEDSVINKTSPSPISEEARRIAKPHNRVNSAPQKAKLDFKKLYLGTTMNVISLSTAASAKDVARPL